MLRFKAAPPLTLLCFLILQSSALAEPAIVRNLVPRGDFEPVDERQWVAPWTRGDPSVIALRVEDGNHFVQMHLKSQGAAITEQTIDLPANSESIDVSVRVRASETVKGNEDWQTGMLQYQFYDREGQRLGGWPKLKVNADTDGWVPIQKKGHQVPEGAVKLKVQCGVWGAAGRYDFDDVVVTANRSTASGRGDHLLWADPEVVELSASRAMIPLNSRWQYMPAHGDAARAPRGMWEDRVVPDRGGNDARMWYQREVAIPADWTGRAILLDLERVSTDATVWINGREVGEINWPGGTIDITEFVKPGEDNEVRLLIVAVDDLNEVTRFMGYLQEATEAARLAHRGLVGDVTLQTRPLKAHVKDVFVQPSVRQGKLFLEVELEDVDDGTVRFDARMLNERGEVEQAFEASREVVSGDSVIQLAFDWPNPRLWDYRQPNLYTMRLSASGAGLDDVVDQVFGFREFWIEGRRFFLNGTEFRLRPVKLAPDQPSVDESTRQFEQWAAWGYNFAEAWPADWTRRGTVHEMDVAIDAADHVGFPIAANAPHMKRVVEAWEDDALRRQWRRILERSIRKWRNHPSVVMYSHTGNAFGNRSDGDPWLIGQTDFSPDQEYTVRAERVWELIGELKRLDPKPVFAHHGAYNGDVYTSNMYLNFLPLQEREEWISHWAQHGELPFMSVEFGLPLYATVMRGRSGYSHQGESEPFMTEWAASIIGPEAYAMETAAYREKVIAERYKGNDRQAEYQPHIRTDNRHQIIEQAPAFQKVLDLFVTRTFRSWRAMGLTGGLIPWNAADFPQVHAVNGPALAWITGPGGVPNQEVDDEQPLTDRTHHYVAGQQISKQIILINDYRRPIDFEVDWQIVLDGRVVASDRQDGGLHVAETRSLPVVTSLPSSLGAEMANGRVLMSARIGEQRFEDVFDFRAWSEVLPPENHLTVAAFDPRGDTTAWLESIGVVVEPWRDGQPPREVAIIGRHALSDGHQIPGDMKAFVHDGGRLLIFTQDAAWLRHAMHLRTAPQLARQAFVVNGNHPVVRGFDRSDLSYWNGSSTATEGYPRYPNWEWTPKSGWHWGNRHAVSSSPIEKPHRGSWTPIVEHEFDLAYTPLMEMRYGAGVVIFNTFDVEARTHRDPVAQRLTLRLIRYTAEGPWDEKPEAVSYLGGHEGRRQLDEMGAVYRVIDDVSHASGLLIVGPDIDEDDELKAYVNAGGRVVVLRRDAATAPFGVALRRIDEFIGGPVSQTIPEAAGLSASDLRWRAPAPAWVLVGGDGFDVTAGGQLGRLTMDGGVVVFAQLGSAAVPADNQRYLRFTRWRQMRGLSQVLANVGVTFRQDHRFFDLLQEPDHYVPLAGRWRVHATKPLPESPKREWNASEPITDRAISIIRGDSEVDWHEAVVPGYLEGYRDAWRWVDGEFVYRKVVEWPAHAAGKPAVLSLGRVDEDETSFVNAVAVGQSQHWLHARAHEVASDLMRGGENVIIVRVWDRGIHGGMVGDPSDLFIKVRGENPGFYHDDYIGEFGSVDGREEDWKADHDRWKVADNPYRYYRW